MQHDDTFSSVHDNEGIAGCLNILMQHSGASLLLSRLDSGPLPVIVVAEEPGRKLLLDISSIREVTTDLKHGMEFRLLGQLGGTFVRSSPLKVSFCEEIAGRMQCECSYPDSFEVAQRRKTFRVEVPSGWCSVTVCGSGRVPPCKAELRNLSPEGCMVALPLTSAAMLAAETSSLRLELKFLSGLPLVVMGAVCRQQAVPDQRALLIGFQFSELSAEQNRNLWFHLHEIERAGGRRVAPGQALLSVRPLNVEPMDVPLKGTVYPTPMARSLVGVAEFLDTQIIALRIGEDIDSAQLSRHSEDLLVLLDQGRESLLFAIHCLVDEPEIVRHSLAVAVRMADITGAAMPREICKAIIASAMIHDLGQILVAPGVLQNEVDLLLARMKECRWLAPEVVRQVVEQGNERLDGSGYPNGLRQPELRELARLMAVVKTVDAMGRASAAGPAQSVDAIYRHLLKHPGQFDQNWVKRYIRHFGLLPVGTLVTYERGEMAWVRSLDERMQPAQVQLTSDAGPPRVATLGDVLQGSALAELGKVVRILVP